MKITNYQKIKSLNPDSLFLVDGATGTKTILAPDLARELLAQLDTRERLVGLDFSDGLPRVELKDGRQYFLVTEEGEQKSYRFWYQTSYDIANMSNTGYLRTVMFRGKNLGDHVTDEQWAAIKAGTFDDMFLGDYWDIDGVTWKIVDFDYYYRSGSSIDIRNHHIVIMPLWVLYAVKWNEARDISGGYAGSYIYKTGLAQAKQRIFRDFGEEHILGVEKYISNKVTDGKVSGQIKVILKVDLPEETMISGVSLKGDLTQNSLRILEDRQLAFYNLNSSNAIIRAGYWTKTIINQQMVACYVNDGSSAAGYADESMGIRPVFAIYTP